MTIARHHIGPRMSQMVIHGDTIYLAGQVASDLTADIVNQTQQVVDKIDALLSEAGSDKTKLLTAQIWLASIGNFAQMNTVWDAWIPEGNTPARACIEARLASPEYLVEIGVIAAL
jgi:enamine deaminase RidA (YjgF/YER057c/UK114 family)